MKIFALLSLIPACAIAAPASHSSAAAVVITSSAAHAAAESTAAISLSSANSGCQSCHQQIFPFAIPEALVFGPDCDEFTRQSVGGDFYVLTRKCGKIRRLYVYKPFGENVHAPELYLLPADDDAFNPHYLLKREEGNHD